jgi:ferredoxin-type protein NapH
MTRRNRRLLARTVFFALFVLAPPLDLLRLDLNFGHFVLFGRPWTLGLAAFQAGEIGSGQAALNLLLRGFLPGAALVGVLGFTAWKWGRLYCGWLCPHFSVVEAINGLMLRAFGTPTLWERRRSGVAGDRRYGVLVAVAVFGFAFLWALTLLTYLLPPREIYHNLLSAALTRNQAIFLGAATLVFSLEFLLARHLFCRFGCAVGVFQSFVWMANKRAMVVGFEGERAAACVGCVAPGGARAARAACDHACPMRLKPRTIKRYKFACTQCGQCLSACEAVQRDNPRGTLLRWVEQEAARQMSERDFGRRPGKPPLRSGCGERGQSQLGVL